MLQQEYSSARAVHQVYAHKAESMNVLAYKSVAVTPPSNTDIQNLMQAAHSRNTAEGLTGILLYDRGTYFQWLEGPTEPLYRVWNSISRDPRHRQVHLLRDEPISGRVFEGWDLRVVMGSTGIVDAAVAAMDSSSDEFKRVVKSAKSLIDRSLEDVLSSVVIPRLSEVLRRDALSSVHRTSTAAFWHAEIDCAAKLANALMSTRSTDSARFVDSLIYQGANINALYAEVFEPTQLHLGKLWDADECDDFQLTVGLARLQMEIRRVNTALPAKDVCKPNHSVLLCSQPRETHSVGLCMSSEVFNRSGWDVDCEYPTDNKSLDELVHANWFDVLKVSQSGSLRRDSRLASMRTTIDSARSASLNPSLIVMVDGRTFVERPEVYLAVNANAVSFSAIADVSVAERMLATSRSLAALCQVSAL